MAECNWVRPYAPNKDDAKNSSQPQSSGNEPDVDNPYNSYHGLLALVRITNTNADEARGACKKCGRIWHLTFQCRNFLSVKDDNKEKEPGAIQAVVLSELDKIKGKVGKVNGKGKTDIENESKEEEEEESDSSDSDADSEIERIVAERYGKKVSNKGRLSWKKKMDDSDEDGSDSDSYAGKRKKRGRSKKSSSRERRLSDSEDEDEGRKETREKRRKRDESSANESGRQHARRKRRRRSHRHSDDSDSDTSEDSGRRYERRSQRSELSSDFDASGFNDSQAGRGIKRSKKKSWKCHHKEDE